MKIVDDLLENAMQADVTEEDRAFARETVDAILNMSREDAYEELANAVSFLFNAGLSAGIAINAMNKPPSKESIYANFN